MVALRAARRCFIVLASAKSYYHFFFAGSLNLNTYRMMVGADSIGEDLRALD